MAATRREVLRLYKALLREGTKFDSYNLRVYAQRRVRDDFQENKTLTDPEKIQQCVDKGQKNLDMLKRHVLIGSFYSTDQLLIERLK